MKEFASFVEKVDWLFVFLFYFSHVVLLFMSIFTFGVVLRMVYDKVKKREGDYSAFVLPLANISSTAVLVGLLGTVSGIINSAVVGYAKGFPVEQLVRYIVLSMTPTAIGIFVSIVALWTYNTIVGRAEDEE
ncbi:MAG: MotA/TolQ/ExbB proton channel family protein [Thermocrinis sp.]|uniref:MotA/TolQ/ExbB proton channel family protein n=1 Tax=Thermocrinis sp. TaxID=2024383 RepID=UPI003BFB4501